MAQISFNPTGVSTISMGAIPQQVKDDVETLYALTYWPLNGDGSPNLDAPMNDKPVQGNFLVEEATKAEIDQWFAYAKAYAAQRENGPVVLRKSPTKKANRSEGQIHLTVRTPEDAAKEEVTQENANRRNR